MMRCAGWEGCQRWLVGLNTRYWSTGSGITPKYLAALLPRTHIKQLYMMVAHLSTSWASTPLSRATRFSSTRNAAGKVSWTPPNAHSTETRTDESLVRSSSVAPSAAKLRSCNKERNLV